MADTKLTSFLTGLAHNQSQLDAFKADPHSAMTKAGLSQEAQTAVLSKNPAQITKAIGHTGKLGAADADTTVVVVVL